MRPFVPVLCAVITATGFMTALHAAPTSQSTPSAILSKGTTIPVRLESDLQSGQSKAGDIVLFTVDQNVYGPNHVLLLERGAQARGQVSESSGHGALGRPGKLTFTCDYACADDGTHVPLHLSVSVKGGSNGSSGEVAASVTTGSHGYDPYEYYGGYYPGGYYQPSGTTVGVAVDPGRLLAGGSDATIDRGHEYDATVTTDTPLLTVASSAAPSEQLFTLKDKTQVAGTLAAFDGKTYTLFTLTGRRSIPADDVQSIQTVSPVSAP